MPSTDEKHRTLSLILLGVTMRAYILTMMAIGLALLQSTTALGKTDYAAGENVWQKRALDRSVLTGALVGASDYLARNTLPDGQFDFIKDPLGTCCRKKKERYSLIRHLG